MSEKYAIIYLNLGSYHIARLRALAGVRPGIQVIEIASEQRRYPWRPDRQNLGFACTTLFPDQASESIPIRQQRDALTAALSAMKPAAVVVAGYGDPVMRAAATWARKQGVPSILNFVSTYGDKPRTWWKELLKRGIMRCHSMIAATGRRAEAYALRLGVPQERIRMVGNVVDNDHYCELAEIIRTNSSQVRAELGLPAHYFVSVSRLAPEKNLSRLLLAYDRYRARGGSWDLVLVGSGPMEAELRRTVQTQGIPGVHLTGWKQHDELPRYLAPASCFILASVSESWGLAVNEAMACGLPVLVSESCGCVPELCHDGVNGYRFNPRSIEQLTELMYRVSSSNGQLAALGRAGRKIVASFTPETWAKGMRRCIATAVEENGISRRP